MTSAATSAHRGPAVSAAELPGWRGTGPRQAIVEFVAAVTDPDSAEFVPERDRIAVFDNDGTLWTEQPVYAQLMFAIDRAATLAEEGGTYGEAIGSGEPLKWSCQLLLGVVMRSPFNIGKASPSTVV